MNESAIIYVQSGSRFIRKEHIDKTMYKMLLHGHQKDDQTGRDIDELTTVAWHEAGHALTGKLIGKEVTKVTILSSTSGAGGVTFSTPIKRGLYNIDDLKNQVIELYGGREAERILYKDDTKVTTGASNDIERATEVIDDMITKYGMIDKFGLITLSGDSIDKKSILDEKIRISKELQKNTYDMLDMHYDKLKQIAELLLEKETIYENDIDDILNV
jgi:cell division protease FtsH